MSRARYALYSLVIALVLAGCGQSGPLYMPGNPSQMSVPPAQPAQPAESADDEKEEADDSDNE
jgi:predicted small lipoprotein YifL